MNFRGIPQIDTFKHTLQYQKQKFHSLTGQQISSTFQSQKRCHLSHCLWVQHIILHIASRYSTSPITMPKALTELIQLYFTQHSSNTGISQYSVWQPDFWHIQLQEKLWQLWARTILKQWHSMKWMSKINNRCTRQTLTTAISQVRIIGLLQLSVYNGYKWKILSGVGTIWNSVLNQD